jgi:cytochrome c peroxidase
MHPRSAMSLINVGYRDALTWANPSLRTFEEQVLVPLFGTKPIELGLQGHEARVYAALAKDSVYQRLFASAFPAVKEPVNTSNIAQALSAFLRSIVSFRSPFDRYRFEGDKAALSPSAARGMELFFSTQARCGGCHMAHNVSIDLGLNLDGGSKTATSPSTDPQVFMFHNTGLYNRPGPIVYPDDNTGLYAHSGKLEDVGKFRVPSLRNIAVTAPYMHDGSIATLQEVLNHYVAGSRAPNPRLSESIKPLTLSDDDRRDLIAFLESLTDQEALRDPRWSDPWKRESAR